MRAFAIVAWLLASSGCQPIIHSSAVPTGAGAAAYEGSVVVVTTAPTDSTEVGIVQASGPNADVENLTKEFARRVASLGGNVGVVDTIRTHYETRTRTESYSYSCGTYKMPQTCYGTRVVNEEVGTTSMIGRAFRTGN